MRKDFDIIVIGGGATGLGIGLEAASRGYRTLLLEAYDYGKGTSSKSTKLVHGGIRYLANFDFSLVREGLEERYYFLQNAPHIAKRQSYLIPFQNQLEKIKFWLGIKIYDYLAGKRKLGTSSFLTKQATLKAAPNLNPAKVIGGAIYYDGQFDDTRMLMTLLKTFQQQGGIAKNYQQVIGFLEADGQICGVTSKDQLTGQKAEFRAARVINATGTFSDALMDLAEPSNKHQTVAAAQGTHLVFDKAIFNSEHAILVPETEDGRVLFILPWHGKIVVGTTDIKVNSPSLEPQIQEQEIDFILATLNSYTNHPVSRSDIKAKFCGQRPLVKPASAQNSAKISRKHELFCTANGLITMVGGKWTIYRRMGEDSIDFMEKKFKLKTTKSITKDLNLFGFESSRSHEYPLSVYGSAASEIVAIQVELNNYAKIHPELPYYQAEVIYQVRHEQARTVEDVLTRRTRASFLSQQAAAEAAHTVARLMASELGLEQNWIEQQLQTFSASNELRLINGES